MSEESRISQVFIVRSLTLLHTHRFTVSFLTLELNNGRCKSKWIILHRRWLPIITINLNIIINLNMNPCISHRKCEILFLPNSPSQAIHTYESSQGRRRTPSTDSDRSTRRYPASSSSGSQGFVFSCLSGRARSHDRRPYRVRNLVYE